MKVKTSIQKWGNSLAIRITGPLKTIPNFTEDMVVMIEVNEKGLIIRPYQKKQKLHLFKESELLSGLNAKTAHADEIAILQDDELLNHE